MGRKDTRESLKRQIAERLKQVKKEITALQKSLSKKYDEQKMNRYSELSTEKYILLRKQSNLVNSRPMLGYADGSVSIIERHYL